VNSLKKRVLFVLIALLSLVYLFVEAGGDGDLYIFLCAAGEMRKGHNLYDIYYINDQYRYYYSLLFALLLQPFYSLSYYWVKFFWLFLNALLYVHLLVLLWSSDAVEKLKKKRRVWFFALSVIFSLRFLHENLHASQITILIFWCTVFGLYLINTGKPVVGGAALALGINIKLLPVLLLPYLLYRGYFKGLSWTIGFWAMYWLIPIPFIGLEFSKELFLSWWNLINPSNKQHVLDVDERSFHGLSTLLATLLVANPPDLYALPIKRNIADLPLSSLFFVLNALRLFLIALTFYFLRSWPFKRADSRFQQMTEISYLLLLIPLLFPHQQHYAFLFMCPAFIICLYYVMSIPSSALKRLLIACLSIIYLTANLKILLGEYNRYFEHFKVLTYGALMLIGLLMLVFYRVWKTESHNFSYLED
jgi:hypothetical protein